MEPTPMSHLSDRHSSLLALREWLDKLSEKTPRAQHMAMMDALNKRFNHRIKLVEKYDPNRRYTCFQHAIDLVVLPPDVYQIASRYDDVHPNDTGFIQRLIDVTFEEIDPRSCANNDVIFYFNDGTPTHAGRKTGDEVISKWGTGHLWQHPPLEAPLQYGWDLRYFKPISTECARAEFLAWAATKLGNERLRLLGIEL